MIVAGTVIALALIGLILFSVQRNWARYRGNAYRDLPDNEWGDASLRRHAHPIAVTGHTGGDAGGLAGGGGGDCGSGGGGCA